MAIKRGTNASETLDGTSSGDVLEGLGGTDELFGLGGDDLLFGGDGNDMLLGGTGSDEMHGGTGNDTYFVDSFSLFTSGGDKVVELANGGNDHVISSVDIQMAANVERLTLTGFADFAIGNNSNNVMNGNTSRADSLDGGFGNDTLNGFGGDDSLFGGDGNDVLFGGDGNDILAGDAGNDSLFGDGGDDLLSGGAGIDKLVGGHGKDTMILDMADLGVSGVRYHGHFEGRFGQRQDDDSLEFTGNRFLNLRTLADDKIQSIEVFDMRTGNNSTSFTVSDIAAISDDDDFIVMGGVGDTVSSTGQGWTHLADLRIGSDLFEHYAKNGVDVFVDSDITQVFS